MTTIIESSADINYPVISLQSKNLRNNYRELERLSGTQFTSGQSRCLWAWHRGLNAIASRA